MKLMRNVTMRNEIMKSEIMRNEFMRTEIMTNVTEPLGSVFFLYICAKFY